MSKARMVPVLLIFVLATLASAQWVEQRSGTTARFRGVSAASDKIVWASGSGGTYALTTDGGETWRASILAGAAKLDFRDVEAIDANTAYLLSIGPGEQSKIFKTTNAGRDWTIQFTNRNPKAFFDSIAFSNPREGVAISDPVDGKFIVIKTTDGGATWNELSSTNLPLALEGEGAFAASGTCIAVHGSDRIWFVTGGAKVARVFRSIDGGKTWTVANTPIIAGNASSGIFSIAFADSLHGVIVGGDYKKENEGGNNVAITGDGGSTWTLSKGPRPAGFRSAVSYVPGRKGSLVVVGPSGSDYSTDGGESWISLGSPGFHAMSFSSRGADAWGAGENGRLGRLRGFPKTR